MATRHLRLTCLNPEFEGKNWEADGVLHLGRLENLNGSINDPSISRRHAEIEFTDNGWVVRDVGSTNGTFLNGERVGRGDLRLRPRDLLQCGEIRLLVAALEGEHPRDPDSLGQGMQIQCSTAHTWDESLDACLQDTTLSPVARGRLQALLRIGREFSSVTTVDALLSNILADALKATDAQGGAMLLLDEDAERLTLQAILPRSRSTEPGVWYSRSLAKRTITRRESLLCGDVRNDMPLGDGSTLANGMVASVLCLQLRSQDQLLGVLHLDRGPTQPAFSERDLRFADALAASVATVIESVRRILDRERDLLMRTLTALAQAVDLRDDYTGSHTHRVTDYALMLADELKLSRTDKQHLQSGTPLHDIGKIGISDYILRKPGPLTPEEAEYMKTHAEKGAAIVDTIPHLAPIVSIVRSHHERWDGLGYPDGLAGEQIPLLARIVAVADAFDAMTTDRPYRRSFTSEKAFQQIREKAGTQFDPTCAIAFFKLRSRIEERLLQAREVMETITAAQLAKEMARVRSSNSTRRRTISIPKAALLLDSQKNLALR